MKRMPHLIVRTFLFSLWISGWTGCTDEQSVKQVQEQNPNGTLRMIRSMKGEQLHGRCLTYYPDGKMESDSRWHNGRRTGVTRLFYRNGVLKDSSSFVNDSLNGPSLHYYHNGALKRKSYFTNGIVIGTTVFFDSTGKPMQREIYNQAGELIYINQFDKKGKPSGNGVRSIIETPDTISWGKPYSGCIRFGYSLTGRVTMLIGPLVTHLNALDRFQIADTFAVVQPDALGRFCFSYLPRPAKTGRNLFGYKFIHKDNLVDSLSVHNLSGTVPFVVRKP